MNRWLKRILGVIGAGYYVVGSSMNLPVSEWWAFMLVPPAIYGVWEVGRAFQAALGTREVRRGH